MSGSTSFSSGTVKVARQSRRTRRRDRHGACIGPGALGPGALHSMAGGGLSLILAGHDGPGAGVDEPEVMYVTCTAELPAPVVGVMLTETCTSGVACTV